MITIRVKSKTQPDCWRTITVDPGGTVQCDCGAPTAPMCSHIDAVLVHNERGMVHPDDFAQADAAWKIMQGRIAVPDSWRGNWQRNLRWRQIVRPRAGVNPRTSGRPLVCFTGTGAGKDRKAWQDEALASGWDVTDEPSPFTDVLVAKDASGTSAKLKKARQHNTAIIGYDEWPDVMTFGVLPD